MKAKTKGADCFEKVFKVILYFPYLPVYVCSDNCNDGIFI